MGEIAVRLNESGCPKRPRCRPGWISVPIYVLHRRTHYRTPWDEAPRPRSLDQPWTTKHRISLLFSARIAICASINWRTAACLIHARNSHIGQWAAAESGFVILREKFGDRFLFTEYYWDKDACGTAKRLVKLSDPITDDALREVLEERLREIPYAVFMERTRLSAR